MAKRRLKVYGAHWHTLSLGEELIAVRVDKFGAIYQAHMLTAPYLAWQSRYAQPKKEGRPR